jgi:hypothetical protein
VPLPLKTCDCAMMSAPSFLKYDQVLGPDDLRLAADAFEAALQSLNESVCAVAPHAARQLLAHYIIEKALSGQCDPRQLREGALAHLKLAASKQPA